MSSKKHQRTKTIRKGQKMKNMNPKTKIDHESVQI